MIPLNELDVLVLDCQATGPNPRSSRLLEIGWTTVRASSNFTAITDGHLFVNHHEWTGSGESQNLDKIHNQKLSENNQKLSKNNQKLLEGPGHLFSKRFPGIETYIIRYADVFEIPRRVSRITGLKVEDLAGGVPLEQAWKKLVEVAHELKTRQGLGCCPAAVHFSQFENPFLRYFHQQFIPDEPYPFETICTYRLVKRLFPQFPRKTLRAVAGHFGWSVHELRRVSHHVAAAAFIWSRLVPLLQEQGIQTFSQLVEWMNKPFSVKRDVSFQFLIPSQVRNKLPDKPGVYRMSRANGELLYIGKATSLRKRVNTYFHHKKRGSFARQSIEMAMQAANVEVVETASVLEAALLESDEIKRCAPPYNVALKQKERRVVFFSRDFQQVSTLRSDSFPIGPIVSPSSILPLAGVNSILNGEWDEKTDQEEVWAGLGIMPDYAPDTACFWEGVRIFFQQHASLLNISKPTPDRVFQQLMVLGKELHARKREEELAVKIKKEKSIEEGEGDSEGDHEKENVLEDIRDKEGWVWTPESAARYLEAVVRHGARAVRLARWFCLLSESSIAWITGVSTGSRRRLLIFQSGQIVHRDFLEPGQELPIPYSFDRTFPFRQKNFDVVTFDRMRILTTELRRLAGISDEAGRRVCVRLSPRDIVEGKKWQVLFSWI